MSRKNPRFHRINPPLPPTVFNLWMITIIGTLDNQTILNTLYYADAGSPPVAGTESNLVTVWRTANEAAFLAACSNEYEAINYKVQALNLPARIPVVVGPVNQVGTGGVGHAPTTVAGVISKYSNVKGQSGRGRIYIPAVPLSFISPTLYNQLTAGAITIYNTLLTRILASVTGADRTYIPCIVSRRGGTPQTGYTAYSPLTTGIVRPLLGTIRRRRIGRGK